MFSALQALITSTARMSEVAITAAGFGNESYYGKRMPDASFRHELATSLDNGAYGVCRIVPADHYPLVW